MIILNLSKNIRRRKFLMVIPSANMVSNLIVWLLITTKKGTKHQAAKVTYNGYVGIQKAQHLLKMCDSNEYAQMLMEANPTAYYNYLEASINKFGGTMDADKGIYNLGANTNWYDELLRTAVMTNHSLNVSGGTDKAM